MFQESVFMQLQRLERVFFEILFLFLIDTKFADRSPSLFASFLFDFILNQSFPVNYVALLLHAVVSRLVTERK